MIWRIAFTVVLACVFGFQVGRCDADIILDYNVADSELGNLSPTNVNANVSGDDKVAGSGLLVNTSGATWNWRSWNTSNNSFADAVAADDVWTWGFDVTNAVTIDLTTMDIRVDRSGSGPKQFEIQASVNGGAAVSLLTHNFGSSTSGSDFGGIDLSSLGTLKNGDSVEFTLAAWESSNVSGTFDLETFTSQTYGTRINGTITPVPEPAALGVMSGLGCFLLLRRWRRKRKTDGDPSKTECGDPAENA